MPGIDGRTNMFLDENDGTMPASDGAEETTATEETPAAEGAEDTTTEAPAEDVA